MFISAVDEDYDLYCMGKDGVNEAHSAFSFVLNVTSFTLSLWIKNSTDQGDILEDRSNGPILTLYGLRYISFNKQD